jgi:hypothetical protein
MDRRSKRNNDACNNYGIHKILMAIYGVKWIEGKLNRNLVRPQRFLTSFTQSKEANLHLKNVRFLPGKKVV